LKAPDFMEFADQVNMTYKPANVFASALNYKSDIEGHLSNWRATNVNSFIGSNNFIGAVSYYKDEGKPQVKANIAANIFEIDRFVFSPKKKKVDRKKKNSQSFLEKPEWSKTNITYDMFKDFDLVGKFKIKNLSYLSSYVENVSFMMNVKDNIINITDFVAEKDSSPIKSNFSIDINSKPLVKGIFEITQYPLENFGGKTYAIEKGKLNLNAQFEGSATSEFDFMKTAKATISFDVSDVLMKGMDVEMIEYDLTNRTHSKDLDKFLEKNFSSGKSSFDTILGKILTDGGKYTIKDASLNSYLATIVFSATGSFEEWNINANFETVLERIKDKILPFGFKLEGGLANPQLIVEASKLKNKYDSYWKKVEEDKRKAEEDRLKKLKEEMDSAQQTVEKQIHFINSEILSRIERYRLINSDAYSQSTYESISIQANDILSKLKELKRVSYTNYKLEDVDAINLQTEVYEPSLTEFVSKLDEAYVFDLKRHIMRSFKDISNVYKNSSEKSRNYQNTLNAYTMRLVQIGSLVVLNELEEVKKNRNTIETLIHDIENTYARAHKIADSSEQINDIAQLDKIYEKIKGYSQSVQEKLEKADVALKDLFEYIQDVVYFEQTGKHRNEEKENTKAEQEVLPAVEEKVGDLESADVEDASKDADIPQTFTKQEDQIEPVAESLKIAPQEDVQESVEIELPPVSNKPLLVEPSDDYASKVKPSGIISQKGRKVQKSETTKDEGSSLLKPISGEVAVEGNIIRK